MLNTSAFLRPLSAPSGHINLTRAGQCQVTYRLPPSSTIYLSAEIATRAAAELKSAQAEQVRVLHSLLLTFCEQVSPDCCMVIAEFVGGFIDRPDNSEDKLECYIQPRMGWIAEGLAKNYATLGCVKDYSAATFCLASAEAPRKPCKFTGPDRMLSWQFRFRDTIFDDFERPCPLLVDPSYSQYDDFALREYPRTEEWETATRHPRKAQNPLGFSIMQNDWATGYQEDSVVFGADHERAFTEWLANNQIGKYE